MSKFSSYFFLIKLKLNKLWKKFIANLKGHIGLFVLDCKDIKGEIKDAVEEILKKPCECSISIIRRQL